MRRFISAVAVTFALAACEQLPSPLAPTSTRTLLPNQAVSVATARAVPGEYIVVFKNEVADPATLAQTLVRAHGAAHRFTYTHALKGFAAAMSDAAAATLARNPQVAYVEQDQVMQAVTTESNDTWVLDR